MRKPEEVQATYALLEKLIGSGGDCRGFRRRVPGELARQSILGAAAMLHWMLGNENPIIREMLNWAQATAAADKAECN